MINDNSDDMIKSQNKRRKSVSDLQKELEQFLKENKNNLTHFKEAYDNHEKARKFLDYHWCNRVRNSSTTIQLLNFNNEEEVCQHYKGILEKNRSLANKHKKVLNLEAAIRRKKHQNAERSYCGDEKCRREICFIERCRMKKQVAEEESRRRYLEQLERKKEKEQAVREESRRLYRLENGLDLTPKERKKKFWRCPNGDRQCHDTLENEYKDLTSATHWSDKSWHDRRYNVNRAYCDVCCEIEREEMEAREEGKLRRQANGKGGKSWHSYRMYETDTLKPRRVIDEWRDWREHHRVEWISKAPEWVKKSYDISNVQMSVNYKEEERWQPPPKAKKSTKGHYKSPGGSVNKGSAGNHVLEKIKDTLMTSALRHIEKDDPEQDGSLRKEFDEAIKSKKSASIIKKSVGSHKVMKTQDAYVYALALKRDS